jgi:hypothetical protein
LLVSAESTTSQSTTSVPTIFESTTSEPTTAGSTDASLPTIISETHTISSSTAVNLLAIKKEQIAVLSELLFIPQLPKQYAIIPLILFGMAAAEIITLVMMLFWNNNHRKSIIFVLLGFGTLCLLASTTFYGRFIMNDMIQTETTPFDFILDAFMISFFSGCVLLFIHAIDMAVIRVFYDVQLLTRRVHS